MSELREFDFIPLKHAARYPVGKPSTALRFRRQEHVVKITVFVDISRVIFSREIHDGFGCSDGELHCESWFHTAELESLERSRSGVLYTVVRGGRVGLSVRSIYIDLGVPMLVEIRSDSSTSNSLTDRLGTGPSTKHIDTRYFWIQAREFEMEISLSKGYLQRKIVQMMLERCQSLQSLPQQHCKFAGLVFYCPWIPDSTT